MSFDKCLDRGYSQRAHTYQVKVVEETYTNPEMTYTIRPLQLTEADNHRMQEDANHIPTPVVHLQSSASLKLPADAIIPSVLSLG